MANVRPQHGYEGPPPDKVDLCNLDTYLAENHNLVLEFRVFPNRPESSHVTVVAMAMRVTGVGEYAVHYQALVRVQARASRDVVAMMYAAALDVCLQADNGSAAANPRNGYGPAADLRQHGRGKKR